MRGIAMTKNWQLFLGFWILFLPLNLFADVFVGTSVSNESSIQLLSGQSQTIQLKSKADRINIGTKGVVSLFMADEKAVSVTGKKAGYTTIIVQYKDGKMEKYGVRVTTAPLPVVENLTEQLKSYLADIPGIQVQRAEDKVLVTGKTSKRFQVQYRQILGMFKDITIDQVEFVEKDDAFVQLRKYFSDIPSIQIKQIEDKIILSGSVDPKHKDYYSQIIGLFKEQVVDQVRFGESDDTYEQVRRYLAGIPGIQIKAVKDKIVLSGTVDRKHKNYFRQIAEMYKLSVIDVVKFEGEDDTYRQLKNFFAAIPTLEVKEIEDKVIVSGSVPETQAEYYKQIIGAFKDKVIDLVKLPEIGDSVQIHAQVIEVRQDNADDLGIEWFANGPWQVAVNGTAGATTSGSSSTSGGSSSGDSGANSASITGGASSSSSDPTSGGSSASGSSGTSHAPGLTAAGQLSLQQVNFNLIALVKDGKARLLATPKLTVQSGKTASFQVGGEVPISSTTALASSVEWKKFGTQLDIAPVIQDNDQVFINITATVSQLDFSHQVQGNPTLLSKVANTNVKVKDRQSFAIAGLLSNEEGEAIAKVPFLGDLPLIGYVFKRKTKTVTKTETVVLFTPYILKKRQTSEEEESRTLMNPSPSIRDAQEKLSHKSEL
jgi:Flp pilus assembly secretin CpaC